MTRTGRTRVIVAIAVIGVAMGFVLFKGLGNATLYFRTADEAVAQRERLGDRRFRIEGIVVEGSIRSGGAESASGDDPSGRVVELTIEENGVRVDVRHEGDPPELFQPNIPVVLEGRFAKGLSSGAPLFESDRIMIKHGSGYSEKNPDRTKAYVGASGASSATSP